ncbi:hypothetical protein FP026_29140 [Rhizobium tropici]|uniref:Uncharacterized protein n=1 Tax=Rhizobium tropici TaxID=398 RepID=A0A5B0VLC3_RHITR|nr:hypothetical protein [Rhizobium tropici]KAA1175326.1 hypothetical protein FP026_29140 [Rhizobium tropici]
MIGDFRTDALHDALGRAPIEDDMLMALLVLAFAGQNVRVDSGADSRPVPGCPFLPCCGLNRRPDVSRPLARRGAAGPASLRRAIPLASAGAPAYPQACPAGSAGPDL